MKHIWFLLALFVVLKAGTQYEENVNLYKLEEAPDTLEENTLDTLLHRYEELGVRFPIVVLAQSSIETGWWTSDIWKENRNGYGMKYNTRGWATGVNRGHAKYPSSAYSLLDYRDWQRQCLRLRPDVDTEEEYIDMLDNLPLCKGCRYAEDVQYTRKVRDRIALIRKTMGTSSVRPIYEGVRDSL